MHYVFDLDGTICFNGQPLSPTIVAALNTLLAKGHELIFASARPIRDLLPVLPEAYHHLLLIGGNGALVSRDGHISVMATFSNDTIQRFKQLIDEHSIPYLADGVWDYSYTGNYRHPLRTHVDSLQQARCIPFSEHEAIIKLVLFDAAVQAQLTTLPVTVHEHKGEQLLDISPLNVDKGRTLRQLGINHYIAVGNDANDVSMFKQAHYAVRVGQHEALAPYAHETLEADEEVIAAWINRR